MAGARALTFLELDANPQGLTARLVTASLELRVTVSEDAVRARAAIVAELAALAHAEAATSFPAGSAGVRTGRATLRASGLWDALSAWDWEHVGEPVWKLVRGTPTVILHAGQELRWFSLRGALHRGVVHAGLPVTSPLDALALPLWSQAAVPALLRDWPRVTLPVVDPRRLHVMFGRFAFMVCRVRLCA